MQAWHLYQYLPYPFAAQADPVQSFILRSIRTGTTIIEIIEIVLFIFKSFKFYEVKKSTAKTIIFLFVVNPVILQAVIVLKQIQLHLLILHLMIGL